MPSDAPQGLFTSIGYFFAVHSARSKRSTAMGALSREVTEQETQLEQLLRSLGDQARQAAAALPQAAVHLESLATIEQERQHLAAQQGDLQSQIATAQQEFAGREMAYNQAMEQAKGQLEQLQAQLTEQNKAQQEVKSRLADVEKQLKELEKERDAKRDQANKSQDTSAQENLQREAAESAVRIGDSTRQRDELSAALAAFQQPIVELNAAIQQVKQRQAEAQKELSVAKQALEQQRRAIEGEGKAHASMLADIDAKLDRALIDIGRAVDSARPPNPVFSNIYSRADGLRAEITHRTQLLERLETERQTYDLRVHKKGRNLLFGLIGGGISLVAGLIIVLSLVL